MNNEDEKPTKVLNELKGIRDLLDDEHLIDDSPFDDSLINENDIPILDEIIPELTESIPVLDEEIEIMPNIRVTLDSDNSTETVEQQLVRIRYEIIPDKPQLVTESNEESTASLNPVETSEDRAVTNIGIDSIDFNIQDQLQQFEQGVPAGHPQSHQKVLVQNELAMDDDTDTLLNTLLDTPEIDDSSLDAPNEHEKVIKAAWEKVEMLLMENLPPQLSGAFLELLNSRIKDNKQQLIDELSLLDDASFLELLEALDINEGF